MENFHPLKEKNRDVVGKIMAAFGITKIQKQSINLRQYMHFNSILKYYSARPEAFLAFWMKVSIVTIKIFLMLTLFI